VYAALVSVPYVRLALQFGVHVLEELGQEPESTYKRARWHMELAERRMREMLELLNQAKQ
jgi:hypothetical protein